MKLLLNGKGLIPHKNEQFSAFRILPLIPQKEPANYLLPIFRILPLPQILRDGFSPHWEELP